MPELSRSQSLPCLNLFPGQGLLHSISLAFRYGSLSEIWEKEPERVDKHSRKMEEFEFAGKLNKRASFI